MNALYFSPTGNTRKVVKAFAKGFGGGLTETDITLPEARKNPAEPFLVRTGGAMPEPLDDPGSLFSQLTVLAGPVYGGRSFKMLTNAIAKLDGNGRPAVLICTYGGRHYDMALADLYEAAVKAGFTVVACGAFVGEHSFSKKIHTGRPDADDLRTAEEFGRTVITSGNPAVMLEESEVPGRDVDYGMIGMHGQRLGHLTPNRPSPTEDCIQCGICAAVCPLGLIDPKDSHKIQESCMKCGACVKLCPHHAMRFPQEDFRIVQEDCISEFGSDIHLPEYFVKQ